MGGFSTQSGDGNDGFGSVMNADNICFNGTSRGECITLDGQLLIGSSSGQRIKPGRLTAGTGISIANGANSITISAPKNLLLNIKFPSAYPYTIDPTDQVVLVDTSSVRSILLNNSPVIGETHSIKDSTGTAGANNITVNGNGNTIDKTQIFVINTNFQSITTVYTGFGWNII